MQDSTEILKHIDTFLADHSDWLPQVTVDFALDLRLMVSESSDRTLESAAA
jgi:hypothetical protein